MDELEISGKRYISSRRAAKDNNYTQDYVGQLIRSGKVKGQKVGRAWYVESASLHDYLENEPKADASPEILSQRSSVLLEDSARPFAQELPTLQEPEQKKEEPEPVRITINKEPEVASPKYEVHSGLRYIEEEENPLPDIERKIRISRQEAPVPKAPRPTVRKSKSTAGRIFTLMVGVVLVVAIAGAASFVTYRISAEEGKTAS